MLAGGVGIPPDADMWMFEPKWDGVRAIAELHRGVGLFSRNGNDVTAGYPELAATPVGLAARSAVLDGEIVTFDPSGRPSFGRLQSRMHVRHPSSRLLREVPCVFVAFDLLWLDGEALVDRPQWDRRRALEALELGIASDEAADTAWKTCPLLPHAPDDELLAACRAIGFEGYMAKRSDATYRPGQRTSAWSKIKVLNRREFVVGGWSAGSGRRTSTFASLAVGAHLSPDGPLRYMGQVGTGLTDANLDRLTASLSDLARDTSPFDGPTPRGTVFVEPLIVVEVAFNEITSAGILRQPSIKGFRSDIRPGDVVIGPDPAP